MKIYKGYEINRLTNTPKSFQLMQTLTSSSLISPSGIIYTFNVEVPKEMRNLALKKGVTISEHTVIYHLIDHLKEQISAQLPLRKEEEVLGMLQPFLALIV